MRSLDRPLYGSLTKLSWKKLSWKPEISLACPRALQKSR